MAENQTRTSRRAVLGAAAGAALAMTADALTRPETATATVGAMMFGSINQAGADSTELYSSGPTTMRMVTTGVDTVAAYGSAESGFAVIGDISIGLKGSGRIGVWGRDRDNPGKIGTAGTSYNGTGVVGHAAAGAGDAIPPTPAGQTGVYGFSPGGTGVAARSDTGTALRVTGKAAFSRSGRAVVAKGKSYVDVDLTAIGGLSGAPIGFANLLTRRAGVHVETVHPNDPAAGKMRIYLNKVASTTSSTTIAWMVLG